MERGKRKRDSERQRERERQRWKAKAQAVVLSLSSRLRSVLTHARYLPFQKSPESTRMQRLPIESDGKPLKNERKRVTFPALTHPGCCVF